MGQPAATATSPVVGVDTHIVLVPSPGGPIPTPLPHPFAGTITGATIPTVSLGGQPAAVVGSVATNQPPHVPTPPGSSFLVPPTNQATVHVGSFAVQFGGQFAARNGDVALTCNDPAPQPVGNVIAPNPAVMVG